MLCNACLTVSDVRLTKTLEMLQVRLKQKLRISQLQLQRLKLLASADALSQLSSSAEYTLQTELAEADSRLASKQTELEDVSVQLQDQRENLTSLQQVCFCCPCLPGLHCASARVLFPELYMCLQTQVSLMCMPVKEGITSTQAGKKVL